MPRKRKEEKVDSEVQTESSQKQVPEKKRYQVSQTAVLSVVGEAEDGQKILDAFEQLKSGLQILKTPALVIRYVSDVSCSEIKDG